MSLKDDERTIDGLRVKTSQFPAMRSFRLMAKLVKAIGPALGALTKLDPGTQIQDVGGELAGAFGAIDPDEAERLVPMILERTSVSIEDGKFMQLTSNGAIDLAFNGRLKTLFATLAFVLQMNYADFMPGSAPDAPLPQALNGD